MKNKRHPFSKNFSFTEEKAKSLATHSVCEFIKSVKARKNSLRQEKRVARAMLKKVCAKFENFKLLSNKDGGTAYVVLNKDENIIVKFGGTTDISCGEHIPYRAVPTAFVDIDDSMVVRVQPKVNTSKDAIKRAMNFLENKSLDEIGYDLHDGNVGKYKGKYVVHDW